MLEGRNREESIEFECEGSKSTFFLWEMSEDRSKCDLFQHAQTKPVSYATQALAWLCKAELMDVLGATWIIVA